MFKFLPIYKILEIRGKINSILQNRLFPNLITLKTKKFPIKDEGKGPFVALLGYNTCKSAIERFFVKPNVVLYSNDRKYIYLQFQFRVSEKTIIETRLKPKFTTYSIIKKNRRGDLQLHKISANQAFSLISHQVPYVSTFLDRNPRLIPASVKKDVWERDKGRCANCGSSESLQFDHIIPFSKGGSPEAPNIQLLCKKCNLHKSAKVSFSKTVY